MYLFLFDSKNNYFCSIDSGKILLPKRYVFSLDSRRIMLPKIYIFLLDSKRLLQPKRGTRLILVDSYSQKDVSLRSLLGDSGSQKDMSFCLFLRESCCRRDVYFGQKDMSFCSILRIFYIEKVFFGWTLGESSCQKDKCFCSILEESYCQKDAVCRVRRVSNVRFFLITIKPCVWNRIGSRSPAFHGQQIASPAVSETTRFCKRLLHKNNILALVLC